MSPNKAENTFRILVDGDVVVDHAIYLGCCRHPADGGDRTRIIRQRAGAGLTADLLTSLCAGDPTLEVGDLTPPLPTEESADPSVHHAYATWAPYPGADGKVWRMKENLGFGEANSREAEKSPPEATSGPGDVVVIDETGLGYRNRPHCWPADLGDDSTSEPWTVLRMAHPVCRGELWARLQRDENLDRLVVIVSVDDLRRSGAVVTAGLSWEKSIGELLGELAYHAEINQIVRARHVIVNFGCDGALWVDNSDHAKPRRRLVFDPGNLEGTWEEDLAGDVTGRGACLTAAVARALFAPTTGEDGPGDLGLTGGTDLGAGILRGLEAGRALMEAGHGPAADPPQGFPLETVMGVLTGDRGGDLRTVPVPDFAVPEPRGSESGHPTPWSIIAGDPVGGYRPLFGRARKVALQGEAALSGIPFGRFGKLYTVDRLELMGYYGIRQLMMEYVEEKNPGRPLSLGVFGPPGSGKSFGIKQIIRGILGKNTPIQTFNLSQFTGPEMLTGALHQIRDEVLKGHTPVAFWDEFDSRDLMWLQYMLAPMNDGEFLEGQVTHPIGKCIFVFAGGTSDRLENFAAREPGEETQEFVNAKGPDFVSRLKGYLNVLGPNPRTVGGEVDPADVGFPIRRAIMLRVLAGRFGNAPLDIDRGLLNAFLKVGEFKHGARSMETIIKLTTDNGKLPLLPSNLPPREQMGLHVDVDAFMALVHEDTRFKLKNEELAPHVHGFYLELAEKEGWVPDYPMPFDELPDAVRQDNLAAARRITDVLALAGLLVVEDDAESGLDPALLAEILEENIELLAEAEHDGWMDFKKACGWVHGERRDNEKKIHPSMVAYNKLAELDREKDRNAVRHFPEIVGRAGFAIRLEGLS